MKKFVFILYSAIFLLQSGCSNKDVFELFEGGSLDFGDPGKFVIVNYWANGAHHAVRRSLSLTNCNKIFLMRFLWWASIMTNRMKIF